MISKICQIEFTCPICFTYHNGHSESLKFSDLNKVPYIDCCNLRWDYYNFIICTQRFGDYIVGYNDGRKEYYIIKFIDYLNNFETLIEIKIDINDWKKIRDIIYNYKIYLPFL